MKVPMVCMFNTILCIMHYGTYTALGFPGPDNLVMTWSEFKVVLTTIFKTFLPKDVDSFLGNSFKCRWKLDNWHSDLVVIK